MPIVRYATHNRLAEGDFVLLYRSPNAVHLLTLTAGEQFCDAHGTYRHTDMIGMEYGSVIRSHNGRSKAHLLHPTVEWWSLHLPHRTQIIYMPDIAVSLSMLQLGPGARVVESGTGSGSMTHALARLVQPSGRVFTFEYHGERARKARQEFHDHGLAEPAHPLVQVTHRDVCRHGFRLASASPPSLRPGTVTVHDSSRVEDAATDCDPLGDWPTDVNAVFLDLPEPWMAVPHTVRLFGGDRVGRIGCFSPCMEQVQRTVHALALAGYHDIETYEYVQHPLETRPSDRLPSMRSVCLGAGGTATTVPCLDPAWEQQQQQQPQRAGTPVTRNPHVRCKGHTAFLTFASFLPLHVVPAVSWPSAREDPVRDQE